MSLNMLVIDVYILMLRHQFNIPANTYCVNLLQEWEKRQKPRILHFAHLLKRVKHVCCNWYWMKLLFRVC